MFVSRAWAGSGESSPGTLAGFGGWGGKEGGIRQWWGFLFAPGCVFVVGCVVFAAPVSSSNPPPSHTHPGPQDRIYLYIYIYPPPLADCAGFRLLRHFQSEGRGWYTIVPSSFFEKREKFWKFIRISVSNPLNPVSP